MRIRLVYATDCNICDTMRAARDLPGYSDEPIAEDVYANVLDKSWSGYTDRERLILEFTERYVFDFADMAADDAFFARLRDLFTEEEIADLCALAAHWECGFKIIQLFLGPGDVCEIPAGDKPAADLAREAGFGRQPAAF